MPENKLTMDKLVSLCQRRGFIFPSSDIYGGLSGCWDYGPVGIELKRNVKEAWWRAIVQNRDDMVGVDTSILMNSKVWEASGHVTNFSDPLVECKNCHLRWKADDISNDFNRRLPIKSSNLRHESTSEGNIIIKGLVIDAPNSSVKLKTAELFSGGKSNKMLTEKVLNEKIKFGAKQYPLVIGKTLFPGEKEYILGFEVIGGAFGAVIRMVFEDEKVILPPIKITVNFGNMDINLLDDSSPYCPSCGGELTEERMFNTMFKTFVGPVEEDAAVVYLRPETAQGMFVNFQNVVSTARKRLPFGIAQQGKAFRNEITTGNFIFRSREFEIMEFEYFVKPGTDEKWWSYWVEERLNWYLKLGMKKEHLKLHPHPKEKLAHYARACTDITYQFPHGWAELEGIANRTDYDLKQHAAASGKSMEYFDDETKEHYVPFIVEPSVGVDRAILAFLCDAYDEEPDKDEIRVVFHFHPDLAPIKAAVLPLSRKENLAAFAKDVYANLQPCFTTQYDDTQSIGRRYRRQDELGTPYCVTIDFQSLEDNMATIRERDSMNQIRIPTGALKNTLLAKLAGEDLFVLPEGGKIWKQGGND